MKLVAKRLTGIALSAFGTVLLTVALEQILDPEQPGDLLTRAAAAGKACVVLIGLGVVITAIAAGVSKPGERFKMAKMVASLFATPTGIALSLAASFAISAAAAAVIATGAGGVVAVVGMLLIAGGFFLGRGFWSKLLNALLAALRSPRDNPDASSTGTGTDPAPAQP